MPKCARCGRKGLFLRLSNGLCSICASISEPINEPVSSPASVATSVHDMTVVMPSGGRKRAYFKNGILYKTEPSPYNTIYDNREIALADDCIIHSDGSVFDPEIPSSISKLITINPRFADNSSIPSPVLDLSYNLKMRCGVIQDKSILPAYVDKVLELMIQSPIGYTRSDYLQVIRNYYRLGMNKEGNLIEVDFRNRNPEIFTCQHTQKQECDHLSTKYHFEHKFHRDQEYQLLCEMLPEQMPATAKGYAQIKSRRTKRFQEIQIAAENCGYSISLENPYHFCEKFEIPVEIEFLYKPDPYNENRNILTGCTCPRYKSKNCDGINMFGLPCVYPAPRR